MKNKEHFHHYKNNKTAEVGDKCICPTCGSAFTKECPQHTFCRNKGGSLINVLYEIQQERKRQDEKWGVQNHSPIKWVVILAEEFGEVAKGALESNTGNYREELIQVAAVAVAMLESLDRQQQSQQQSQQ